MTGTGVGLGSLKLAAEDEVERSFFELPLERLFTLHKPEEGQEKKVIKR